MSNFLRHKSSSPKVGASSRGLMGRENYPKLLCFFRPWRRKKEDTLATKNGWKWKNELLDQLLCYSRWRHWPFYLLQEVFLASGLALFWQTCPVRVYLFPTFYRQTSKKPCRWGPPFSSHNQVISTAERGKAVRRYPKSAIFLQHQQKHVLCFIFCYVWEKNLSEKFADNATNKGSKKFFSKGITAAGKKVF